MAKDKILTWKGCDQCTTMKKNGMCKENRCIEVSSKEGQRLAKKLGITTVPTRICEDSKGNFKKCDIKKLYKDFS